MCGCLNDIAVNASKKHANNGKDACVQATVKGEIRIVQWVMESNPYKEKILRRAKHSKHEGIKFNFCPICGVPNSEHQHAQVWEK